MNSEIILSFISFILKSEIWNLFWNLLKFLLVIRVLFSQFRIVFKYIFYQTNTFRNIAGWSQRKPLITVFGRWRFSILPAWTTTTTPNVPRKKFTHHLRALCSSRTCSDSTAATDAVAHSAMRSSDIWLMFKYSVSVKSWCFSDGCNIANKQYLYKDLQESDDSKSVLPIRTNPSWIHFNTENFSAPQRTPVGKSPQLREISMETRNIENVATPQNNSGLEKSPKSRGRQWSPQSLCTAYRLRSGSLRN